MSAFYKKMEATAKRLIKKFGIPVSLIKKGNQTGGYDDFGNPILAEPDVVSSGDGVVTLYETKEINGASIIAGDVKLVFSLDKGSELPVIGMTIPLQGKQWRVQDVNPVTPADINICYFIQLRS